MVINAHYQTILLLINYKRKEKTLEMKLKSTITKVKPTKHRFYRTTHTLR